MRLTSTHYLAGFTAVLAALVYLATQASALLDVRLYGYFAAFALIGLGAWTWRAADEIAEKERKL
jgi:hypothetical protein